MKIDLLHGAHPLKPIFIALIVLCCALLCVDVVVRQTFPLLDRMDGNFSESYLLRVIRLSNIKDSLIFAGDSVLWGHDISARQTAVYHYSKDHGPVINLSFEGGSLVNTYSLVQSISTIRGKPKAIFFNVNIKEFNRLDSAYNTLHPALERVAWPVLTPDEQKLLHPTQTFTVEERLNRNVEYAWQLYGLRNDLREILFGQADFASALEDLINTWSGEKQRYAQAHVATTDRFLGTYDLSPLDDANVEVIFLRKLIRLVHDRGIPAYAMLTPTNHSLLHDYIDCPEYDNQLKYVSRMLRQSGIHVLNYDRKFAGNEFLDNDHLTVAGNVHLARLLEHDVRL